MDPGVSEGILRAERELGFKDFLPRQVFERKWVEIFGHFWQIVEP